MYNLIIKRVNFGHQAHHSMTYALCYDSLEEAVNARKLLFQKYYDDAIKPTKLGGYTLYTGKYHYDPEWPSHYCQEYYQFTIKMV